MSAVLIDLAFELFHVPVHFLHCGERLVGPVLDLLQFSTQGPEDSASPYEARNDGDSCFDDDFPGFHVTVSRPKAHPSKCPVELFARARDVLLILREEREIVLTSISSVSSVSTTSSHDAEHTAVGQMRGRHDGAVRVHVRRHLDHSSSLSHEVTCGVDPCLLLRG